MAPLISVVIPVYNSIGTLTELTRRLIIVLENLALNSFELVFIDDGSVDTSFEKLLDLHRSDNRIKAIRLQRNFGQQNAILCGLRHAEGDFIITMDDDLQNPPEEIPKLLNKLSEGFDAVFGIPANKRHTVYRNIGSTLIDFILTSYCGKPHDIKVSSFRVLRREVTDTIKQTDISFVYLAPMIFRATEKTANVTVQHCTRQVGHSGYSLMKLIRLAMLLLINYSGFTILVTGLRRPVECQQYVIAELHL